MITNKALKLYLATDLIPLPGHIYRAKRDIKILNHTVPKRWITNGANTPKILWPWLPPNDSQMMPAVLVHDLLCDIEAYKFNNGIPHDFSKCDLELRRVALKLEVNNIRVSIYYTGVKFYTKCVRPIKEAIYKRFNKKYDILPINIKLIENHNLINKEI